MQPAGHRVRTTTLFAWCGPCLPAAAVGLPLVVYLPPHYAGTLGLPLATVGFLFAIVRLLDMPLDPLLGALMDNSRTRIGQFRPWLLGGGLVMMAGVAAIFFAPPGVSATQAFLALMLFYFGFSCVYLSQTSWGARLSSDYGERARIFGWWTAMNVVGTILILFVPPLVGWLAPGAGPSAAVHAMGLAVVVALPLTIVPAALVVPEGRAAVSTERVRFADVPRVLADRRMVRLLAVDLLLAVVPGMVGALFLFFFTAARGFTAGEASSLLLFYFVAGLAAAPLWIRLAQRLGKHRAAALSALWIGLAQLGVVAIPAAHYPLMAAGMVVAGIPFAAPTFLLRAMLADLVDAQTLDQQMEGGAGITETTGLSYALLTATAKLGYAIPVGLTYPLLGLFGFDPAPGAANGPEALSGLLFLFVAPPIVLGLAAAALARGWPITADVHARIISELAASAPRPLPESAPDSAPRGEARAI